MLVIDSTIDQLLEYVERHQKVSFYDIHEYMLREGLRLGAATNPISVLDLAGYETGRIDVDYDQQMICSRSVRKRTPRAAATAALI